MSVAQPEPDSGPTVRRILLGYQLRKLREAKGITRADAGYKIRGSESKISRLELGRVGFKLRDVEDLLTLYGITEDRDREPLLKLAKESNKPGWWQRYGDALPTWFQSYVGLEEAATRIRTYEAQFLPGLLQTEDYARAIIAGGKKKPDPEDENRIAVRMRRQRRIIENENVKLWAIVDEAAVRRPVGNSEVMRGQLRRLIELCGYPNITLQIIPFSVGAHAAEAGSFTILRYPEYDLADVVYIEQLTGALYLDKRDDVDAYTMAMERLSVAAEPPNHTPRMLERMIDDLPSGTA
ncbi:helix-turn-helix domain-containing protein [Marinactinospora thermotolerans]|uniref:Helix-turn-helix domain-containing protein n=1 Tax=Marinactinospora thermotolerans DSM 45154 TaxID=1122192 RepID=A0A1T4RR86_9ACTN|nr:helix-turn-helix transcriptional regulator [Marinactinospora thermotolerans]SKA18397.1 Helix-turn-helix domain-containing protein [Marinactinospora thermotolerans DSM 45154]